MRIYDIIQWNKCVSSATSTTGTLNDLTTDLIMANNKAIGAHFVINAAINQHIVKHSFTAEELGNMMTFMEKWVMRK